jgi:hypothetical protein
VERRKQYKAIMQKEKKEWQDRNVDNIKILLKMKDIQQLWTEIKM